jgi:hypothetical protein
MLAVLPLLELLFAGAATFAGPAAPVAIDAPAAIVLLPPSLLQLLCPCCFS